MTGRDLCLSEALDDDGIDAVIVDRMTDTLTILQCKRPTEDRAAMIAALRAVRDKVGEDVKVVFIVEGRTEELWVRQFLATLNQTSIGVGEVYVARANATARRVAEILGRATFPLAAAADDRDGTPGGEAEPSRDETPDSGSSRVCQVCGKAFSAAAIGRPRAYCSQACRARAYRCRKRTPR